MSEGCCDACGHVKEFMEGRWRCRPCRRTYQREHMRARRARPGERLAESMRDTLRHQRNRVLRHNDNEGVMYL